MKDDKAQGLTGLNKTQKAWTL